MSVFKEEKSPTRKFLKMSDDERREVTKWTDALICGLYKQTQRRLQDNVGYCCLGVLCESLTVTRKNHPRDMLGHLFGYYPNGEYIPEWANALSVVCEDELNYSLVTLNDNLCMPFDLIADVIDAWLIEDSPRKAKIIIDKFKEKKNGK